MYRLTARKDEQHSQVVRNGKMVSHPEEWLHIAGSNPVLTTNNLKQVNMSYEHKANTGTLFPNNKKADNHPDYKGKIKVGDQEFDLAGWVKKTDNGQFLSLKLSEPFKPEPQNTSEKIMNSSGLPF